MHAIPATKEVEIRRITVQASLSKKSVRHSSQQKRQECCCAAVITAIQEIKVGGSLPRTDLKNKAKRTGNGAQVVECLPSKGEALSSNISTGGGTPKSPTCLTSNMSLSLTVPNNRHLFGR
jgi:hypothetical protein